MEKDFVKNIREHPKDYQARLVYADWLEENGDLDRAEFVRINVEIVTKKDQFACTQWMFSCGESLNTYQKLLESGCDNCKCWAAVVLKREALLQRLKQLPTQYCSLGAYDWISLMLLI